MKKSFRIALAGIIVGFSLMCMFMSSIFPFAEYSVPAIAGTILVVLVIEFGYKYALMAYAAVSILSLLIVPNKESVFLFILFLGYYPILKGKLESIHNKFMEYSIKIVAFNFSVLAAYFLMINILEMTQLMGEINFMKYGALILLLLGNVFFVIYDVALTRVISLYINVIRPKYLKKFM